MNGCIYRTKYGECTIPNRSIEYGPMCRSDCEDKHPSNADRIRAMTNEEMADFLEKRHPRPWCTFNGGCTYVDTERYGKCWLCALGWLKQEAN